ncbi:MAG: aminotransferase class IV, partial [Bacteroidales bacterium]
GITRKHILDICRENSIKVELVCVKADKVAEFESAFMTGTSPVILPFRCIDNVAYNVKHPLIPMLRNLLFKRMEESLRFFNEGK